jgi:hypothetical protein
MAQNVSINELVIPAVLSGTVRKYRFMKVSGSNTYAECDAEEISSGASKEAGESGDAIKMVSTGFAIVQAGGTIAAGAFVNSDADGKAVTESTTNKWASGKAVTSAVDGDYMTVDLSAAGYISSS